jgi:hypothetical protein
MANDKTEEKPSNPKESNGGGGKCNCPDFDTSGLPGEKDTLRRLIKALEGQLEEYSSNPSEAAKKFSDDLKDLDKEYQGLADIVKKYQDTYDTLVCSLSEANKNKQEISDWCKDKVDSATQKAIATLRSDQYDKKEKEICSQWITYQTQLFSLQDCQRQSDQRSQEAKDDLDAFKNFEKTVKDRLTELKSLYDKAKALRTAERHKSVCAVLAEYCDVLVNLGEVQTWADRRAANPPTGQTEAPASGANDECEKWDPSKFLDKWTPDWLNNNLRASLRALILARYQRFSWYQTWFKSDGNAKKWKDKCDKFTKSRRDDFIQEAEDQGSAETASKAPAKPAAQKPTGAPTKGAPAEVTA